MTLARLFAFVVLAALPGCPVEVSPGGDAPEPLDTGADAFEPPDANPGDQDRDGVPLAMDCDDLDPAIGLAGSRTCSTVCGEGVQTCVGGTWTDCPVGLECVCPIPGETRMVDCGFCGTTTETCSTDNRWVAGECMNPGECTPGATEMEDPTAPPCYARDRTCSDTCEWSAYDWRFPDATCFEIGMCECRTVLGSTICDVCTDMCVLRSGPTCPMG